MWGSVEELDTDAPPTEAEVRALLPGDARLLPITSGWSRARLDDRLIDFSTTGVDLTDPMAEGCSSLESGRLPSAPGEVVINAAMLAKGLALGDDARCRRDDAHARRGRRGRRRSATPRSCSGPPTTSRHPATTWASGSSRPARCRGRPCSTSTRSGRSSRRGRSWPTRPTSPRRPSRWGTTPAATSCSRWSP